MGNIHHILGDVDVVVVAGRGLGIGFKGAIHHHGGEAVRRSTEASGGAVAVVLVHHHRNVGVSLNSSQDQVAKEVFACVGPRTAGRLQDHWGIGLMSRFHDRLHLLKVVHVERRNAVAVFGGVV